MIPSMNVISMDIESKILDIKELSEIRSSNPDKEIVLCGGSFDIAHAGHIFYLEACKRLGDILVVSVVRDSIIKQRKGPTRPIISEYHRLALVAAFQNVDYVVLGEEELRMPGEIDYYQTLISLMPDKYAASFQDSDLDYKRKLCEGLGIEFVCIQDAPPENMQLSTSKIVDKIIDSYNEKKL